MILDYRVHQRRLMPLLAKTYALHFAQAELVDRFDRITRNDDAPDRERRQLESLAAGMKATASWHAVRTIQICRECCGGAGYMSVNRFAALKADTDVFTTFEGDNTVLMMLVARGLLTDYRDAFGELNPRETVLFVAEQAVETVVERLFARKIAQVIADVVPGHDETGDLLDRENQLELFRWRDQAGVRQLRLDNLPVSASVTRPGRFTLSATQTPASGSHSARTLTAAFLLLMSNAPLEEFRLAKT